MTRREIARALAKYRRPGSPNYEYHFRRLPAEILELGPDIICLQEAWKVRNRARLSRALGMDHHSPVGSTRSMVAPVRIDTTGGLFMISRYVVDAHEFVPFPLDSKMSLIERRARKGVLLSRIRSPLGEYWVVNTHVYAGQSDQARSVRLQQLEFLDNTGLGLCTSTQPLQSSRLWRIGNRQR